MRKYPIDWCLVWHCTNTRIFGQIQRCFWTPHVLYVRLKQLVIMIWTPIWHQYSYWNYSIHMNPLVKHTEFIAITKHHHIFSTNSNVNSLKPSVFVGKLAIIGSDTGLSPGRCQTIIWNNARISLIGPLGINFNDILIQIHTFSFKQMYLKMLSVHSPAKMWMQPGHLYSCRYRLYLQNQYVVWPMQAF